MNTPIKSDNIHLKEYGSSIQKMVNYLLTISEREKRTRQAHILVELMRQIHPAMKDGQDYSNKLWDDLYIMSGFQLDVDSPFPPPSPDALGKKPQKIRYRYNNLKYKHFGQNVNLLVERAFNTDDAEERRSFVSYIVRLMKSFYTTWNKETVEDEVIYQSLVDISKGKLALDVQLIRDEGLVEGSPREGSGEQPQKLGRQPQQGRSYAGSYQPQRGGRQQGQPTNNRNQFRNNTGGGNNQRDGGGRSFRGNNTNGGNPGNTNNRRRGR